MWGDFAKKIKDFADDITTPVYEDDEYRSNEATIEKNQFLQETGGEGVDQPSNVTRALYNADLSFDATDGAAAGGITPIGHNFHTSTFGEDRVQTAFPPLAQSEPTSTSKRAETEQPTPAGAGITPYVPPTTTNFVFTPFKNEVLADAVEHSSKMNDTVPQRDPPPMSLQSSLCSGSTLTKATSTPPVPSEPVSQLPSLPEANQNEALPETKQVEHSITVSAAPIVEAPAIPAVDPRPSKTETLPKQDTERIERLEKENTHLKAELERTNASFAKASQMLQKEIHLKDEIIEKFKLESQAAETERAETKRELEKTIAQNKALLSEIQQLKTQWALEEQSRSQAGRAEDTAATLTAVSRQKVELEIAVKKYKEASSSALYTYQRCLKEMEREKKKYDREALEAQKNALTGQNRRKEYSDEESEDEESSEYDEDSEDEHNAVARVKEVRPDRLAADSETFAKRFMEFTTHYQNVRRMQRQWEETYEQAKVANETMNNQCKEAWRLTGQLREELSITKESSAVTEANLRALQERLSVVESELEASREERREQEMKGSLHENGLSDPTAGNTLQFEVDRLRGQLQSKEEEVQELRTTNQNLQQILDSLQQSRTRDVEERTLLIQAELDEAREELGALRQAAVSHQAKLEAAQQESLQALSRKTLEISSLQKKLSDLRAHFEESFVNSAKHGGETVVEKAVVTQLLVKYIHGFIEEKKEAGEILKILSSVLDWGEEEEEEAGLLPGPRNPTPPQKNKPRFAFLRRGNNNNNNAGKTQQEKDANKRSLATLWVDFLMKQSAGNPNANEPTSEPTAPDKPSTEAAPKESESTNTEK
ncbi:hypothetical protein AGDE_13210 [Angomonas deanei]|nr:hypothetical protein AGDE_13210 [Angomonas deanei]|eukprot:EPY22616.1 hypothetical protein AGDE_13210 [Angomonas deanei]